MIKSFTIINFKGESLKLELARPELSGLVIKSVTGLGPPDASMNATQIANLDGSIFNSIRTTERSINFIFQMMFAPSIEDSRHLVYRFFPIKKQVTIQVETDTRTIQAVGYTERLDPDIFQKIEIANVSVKCPDPWFYDLGDSEMIFSGVKPEFEFPFENDPPETKQLNMGEIYLDTRATLIYDGDVDAGIVIHVRARDKVKNVRINNIDTLEWMKIDTDKIKSISGQDFDDGDEILISTVKGDKYVKLLRNGVYSNVIGCLERGSTWFQLTPGANVFNFVAEEKQDKMEVIFSYRNAYGGI